MGEVFRGLDTRSEQPVAVKRLKSEALAESPDLIERFRREGEVLRQLNHPNIVKVLDTLEENNQYYLVMEYVGGGSLADLLRRLLPLRLMVALDRLIQPTGALLP